MPDVNVNAGRPVPVWWYAAGAGGLFVAWTFYKRFRASSTPAAAPTPTMQPVTVPAGSYGQDYSGEIANLYSSIQNLSNTQTSTGTQAANKPFVGTKDTETKIGGGYVPSETAPQKAATPISANNHVYLNVPDLASAFSIGLNNLYYQPTPGIFQTFGGSFNNLPPSTPVFRMIS